MSANLSACQQRASWIQTWVEDCMHDVARGDLDTLLERLSQIKASAAVIERELGAVTDAMKEALGI